MFTLMNRHVMSSAVFAFVIAASPAAFAQAHIHAAPNGGQIQKIGSYEGELVVKGSEVILYVVDSAEKKIDSAPLTATATVLAKGNEQKVVELKPSGDNRLSGKVDFPVEGKFRATVSLKTATGEAGKARFNLDK
jgi:uncharacterized protein (DUF2147 family)